MMKVKIAVRLVAAYVGLVGLYSLFGLVRQLIHSRFRELLSPFYLIPDLLTVGVIFLALSIARRVWRAQTGRNVRLLLVVTFFIIFFQFVQIIDWAAKHVAPQAMSKREEPWSMSLCFASALIFTICYYASRRWLGRGEFLPSEERPALLQPPTREWIMVQAFILWPLIEEWFDVWFPFLPRTELSHRAILVHFFGPMALAWLFYRLLYRWLCRWMVVPNLQVASQ